MCFKKEFGVVVLVLVCVPWETHSETFELYVLGGLLEILQEGTVCVRRFTGDSPGGSGGCGERGVAEHSHRDIWIWDRHLELSQLRQGLLESVQAVP